MLMMMMMITIIIILIIYNRGNLPGNEDLLSLRFYNIIVILIIKHVHAYSTCSHF